MLLSNRAKVDICNRNNNTPLHFACDSHNYKFKSAIVKELVKYGSSLSIKNNDGQSPLDYIVSETERNLLKVQEKMFHKWKNTANFLIVLRHFNIIIDKSKEGTNRAVFQFQLKDSDVNEPSQIRGHQFIINIFAIIPICEIICYYL